MIKGYKKLKDVEPGSLIRLRSGSYALISEYYNSNTRKFDGYLADSGEALYADRDEWVAIVDMDVIEVNIAEELEYPSEG